MEIDFILKMIEDNGYLGLYLWLWLGVVGVPVPNELFIMTVGFAASEKVLVPALMFIVSYCGMVSALTTSYVIGRFIGRPILRFFEKSKRISRRIDASMRLIKRYHSFSLSLSYFLPGLRSFVPFVYGMSKFSFKSFVIFSFTGAYVWLVIVFTVGYLFNDHFETIFMFGEEFFYGTIVVVFFGLLIRVIQRKKNRKINTTKEHVRNL